MECINETKFYLRQTFNIKDLGLVDVILGVNVYKINDKYVLSQQHYIEKLLKKFSYWDCKPSKTPTSTYIKLNLIKVRALIKLIMLK